MRLHDLAREEGLKIGPVAAHVLENVVDMPYRISRPGPRRDVSSCVAARRSTQFYVDLASRSARLLYLPTPSGVAPFSWFSPGHGV
jgi:hypothetical protein